MNKSTYFSSHCERARLTGEAWQSRRDPSPSTSLRVGMTVLLIFLLAAFLRFYRLGEVPPALDWDEVSLGYNAWALGEIGRDEFGNSWPLSIRSFGDYKPPIYAYLLIPSIKIFGRTEFAVRFPSALAGTLTMLVTYLLAKEMFYEAERRASGVERRRYSTYNVQRSTYVPLVAAFLLAISPWHLQFSRIAFEANVGLFFFVTGVWLLLRAFKRNLPWSLFLAALSISLSLMAYHSFRVVAPLMVLGSLIIYKRELRSLLKPGLAAARPGLFRHTPLILSTIITIITIITISYTIFFQKVGRSRFSETSFLTIDDLMTVSRRRIEKSGGNLLDRAVNHRFLVYGRQYLRGYFDHFNLRFWFLDGDRNDRHRTRGVGLMYWWEGPLLIMGLISLIRHISPIAAKEKLVIFLWLFLAPAAAGLTGGTPSAVRSLGFLPIFQILAAIGLIGLISQIRPAYAKATAGKQINRIWRSLLVTCYLLLVTFEITYYFHQYYAQAPVETAAAWQYGYKQLISRIMDEKDNYDKVIVTTAYDQPYIYFLWYGNYDPKFWVNDGEFNKRFDDFEFKKIEWEELRDQKNILVVSAPDETKGKPVKWRVDFPDGKTAFNVSEL